jgi:hypothetical protein
MQEVRGYGLEDDEEGRQPGQGLVQ